MSICITNKKDQFKFDILVGVVGYKEAVRDYYEQNGVVRPPYIVQEKISKRLAETAAEQPSSAESFMTMDTLIEDLQEMIAHERSTAAMQALEDMSRALGVEFEIVSSEKSKQMRNSQEDVPGFYQAGKVYMTEGMLSPEAVFHEFAHPLIKSLSYNNRPLFNALFDRLMTSPEGQAIIDLIKSKYPELSVDSDLFKEEAIVTAIEQSKNKPVRENSFLDRFIIALRQMLRKVFGVDASKLSEKTTLGELVSMLNKGTTIKLALSDLKMDDAIMLRKQYENVMKLVNSESAVVAQNLINNLYTVVKAQTSATNIENSIYSFMKGDGITQEDNQGLLQVLKQTAELMATNSRKPVKDLQILEEEGAVEDITERLAILFEMIGKSSVMMDLFRKKFDKLESRTYETSEDIDDLYALSQFVDQWNSILSDVIDVSFIDYMFDTADENYNKYVKDLTDIRNKAQRLKNDIDNRKFDAVVDILYNSAVANNIPLVQFYEDMLGSLKESGNLKEYNRIHTEFYGLSVEEMSEYNSLKEKQDSGSRLTQNESLRLAQLEYAKNDAVEYTKDSFRNILVGMSADVNGLNHMYENYSMSQDKIIGTFYDFIKRNVNEINAETVAKQNAFLNGFHDRLKQTKWFTLRQVTEGAMGQAMAQIDNVGVWNEETQQVDMKQVYKFKNNFKEFEADRLAYTQQISLARNDYNANPTDENYDAYLDAVIAYEDWQSQYMHQEYVPEFYEPQKLLRDKIGRKARKVLDQFYSELNDMQDLVPTSLFDFRADQAIRDKWNEYRWLFSIYKPDGSEKTGEEREIAERLKQYQEARQNFYEYVDRPNAFQDAYNGYVEALTKEGKGPGTAEFQALMDEWLEHHTVVEIHEEYYEQRKQLLEERSELLKPLMELNAEIEDIGPLYDEIYQLTKLVKDPNGQVNGNRHSAEVQKKIKELHERIEASRENLYNTIGLTRKEMNEYFDLADKIAVDLQTDEEIERFNEYRERVKAGLTDEKFGLTKEQVDRLVEIDNQLGELSVSIATDAYLDTFTTLINSNEDSAAIFSEWYASTTGGSLEDGDVVTDVNIKDFLASDELIEVMSLNHEFEQWFNNNHYTVESVEKDEEFGYINLTKYMKTALWKYTSPKNLSSYKAFGLKDEAGNLTGVLKVNGIPRVPSAAFKDRVVKDQYKTKLIERDYVDSNGNLVLANIDNRGRFLPRTIEQGAVSSKYIDASYMEMFNNDRDMWNLLDYTKNFHLDNQKNLENNKRLGLEYPAARKKGTERYQRKGMLRRWLNSWAQIFGGRASDDFNYGLSMKTSTSSDPELKLDYYNRPVYGTFDLDLNERSTDILDLMMNYQHSVNTHKAMKKVSSLGNVIQNLLNQTLLPENVRKLKMQNKFLALVSESHADSKRATHFTNMIDRYVNGIGIRSSKETTAGAVRSAHSALAGLSHMSSRKFFAFNWISDLTNPISGRLQFATVAQDAKTFFNAKNWVVGEKKSLAAIGQLIGRAYDTKARPGQLQLMQILDASPDLVDHSVGEAGSRTLFQDVVNLKAAYAVRSIVQHRMNFTAMYALMDNKKFKFQINGTGPFVTLDQAVEIRDGKLYTKEGVPQEYQISYNEDGSPVLGARIQQLMTTHKNFLMKTVGMAGRDMESEFANRSLIGKMSLFIFRFLPGLVMDRYQFRVRKELNAAGREKGRYETIGTYLTALRKGNIKRRINRDAQIAEFGMMINAFEATRRIVTGDVFKSGLQRNHILGMTQVATMILIEQLIQLLIGSIWFNTDDDDPDNDFVFDESAPHIYKDLASVTALPDLPGVSPKYSAGEFRLGEFMKLQALRLSLRASRENATIHPVNVAVMAKDILLLNGPIAEGAFTDIAAMGQLIYAMAEEGDLTPQGDRALIGQDSGPYTWGRKGKHKLPNMIWRYYGVTGKMIDPAEAIETEMNFQEIGGAR